VELTQNRKAFLDVIGASEGTSKIPNSDNGYGSLVGGGVFNDYSVHPNPHIWIKSINAFSTASGRYQVLHRFWMIYRKQLNLDLCKGGAFGHEAQDKIALQMLDERRALIAIDSGDFKRAVRLASDCWVSLPGGCQHRPTMTIDYLQKLFICAGGVLK
jgi:muramidase (phage lysozyme)